ncbi:hypothetical protein LCGC14_1015970 [marine sediment metagenome]|uniref:Uncharacterized protein n=1 Tax=marine sediment metagenome TaxID=412755 RepID=A0A0F9R4U5_9ZZZZ
MLREVWHVELGKTFATKEAAQKLFNRLAGEGTICCHPETISTTFEGERRWIDIEKQEVKQ